MPCG
jgi:hypothetical protein